MNTNIAKRHRLNEIHPIGEKNYEGIYHEYDIREVCDDSYLNNSVAYLKFQKGLRGGVGSVQGISDIDLLEILRHRLYAFQRTEMASKDNQMALFYVEEAMKLLHRRVVDRVQRGVLGSSKK